MSLAEAPHHPHNRARGAFVDAAGGQQPAPAPRYSRSQTAAPAPLDIGRDAADLILANAGFAAEDIAELRRAGVVG